ncbi:MAG: BON domain-containing protein [Deltaproteobacteria bacterium]
MNCVTRDPKNYAAGLFLFLCALWVAKPMLLKAGPRQSSQSPRLERRSEARNSNQPLLKKVGHQLRMLAYYSVFDNIEYQVIGSRVELTGQVVQPRLKSDAAAAVKRIEGVTGVVNKIEVLPPSPNDDRIRLDCYRAIFMAGGMQKYAMQPVPSVHIIVKNGNVTLVGVVDSDADKNIAYIKANGVSGAFSVSNNLRVEKPGVASAMAESEVLKP